MKTEHVKDSRLPEIFERPETLPFITPNHLCKGKYGDGEGRHCYTGWLLELFLGDTPYVEAYKEFRLKTMDLMYEVYSEDHAQTPQQRADLFNRCAKELGYKQV